MMNWWLVQIKEHVAFTVWLFFTKNNKKIMMFALFFAAESPDVVCVTETWLHADIPDSLLCCKE